MCGIIAAFSSSGKILPKNGLSSLLARQSWRGPDYTGLWFDEKNRASLGHNRLTILDTSSEANMPMSSSCGRYILVYNGEIYNHLSIRQQFKLKCTTHSDSETLLNLYIKVGSDCVKYLEGMFAFVIYDTLQDSFFAARDQLGIKPLFYADQNGQIIFGSEAAIVNDIVGSEVSETSLKEWRAFRRPLAGRTFFTKVKELLPGYIYDSSSGVKQYWHPSKHNIEIDYEAFRAELSHSISAHLINDFQTVSLLSGGLDSAIISALSKVDKCYTVGLNNNNEFSGAAETAKILNVDLRKVSISHEELEQAWIDILNYRREPLSVPNEGLIYLVCKSMSENEKVVLTGEGADELLFGYDRIFKWGSSLSHLSVTDFAERYSYNKMVDLDTDTLDWLSDRMRGKFPIEFLEDFFIEVHLPGLLRRMDSASMCASKEARVPFVTPKLFNLLYRVPIEQRHVDGFSKSYLRRLAQEVNLKGVLERPKVGFSATFQNSTQMKEYSHFQNFCLAKLNWG